MKHIILILFFILSNLVQGQEKTTIFDFIPEAVFTKQRLLEDGQFTQLNYESMLLDLEKKPKQDLEFIVKDSTQIIYTQALPYRSKKQTFTLTFNANKQLIECYSDNQECYENSSDDMPQPVISNLKLTYNQFGKPVQINGFCGDKSYSIQTNYHYNTQNELDSIIFTKGISEKHFFTYRKMIFVNSAIWSTDAQSSMVLNLNTNLDYVRWLKYQLSDTNYFTSSKSDLPTTAFPFTADIKDQNNYIHEFDSLGRITSYAILNEQGSYRDIIPNVGCDLCEDSCGYPTRIDFYYAKNQISGAEFTYYGNSNAANKSNCRCQMYFVYKKEKLKEVKFYTIVDFGNFNLEKIWTPKKGFSYLNVVKRK